MDISASELSSRVRDNEPLNIIDVRGQLEYNTFNIGGINIPLGILHDEVADLNFEESDEIIVICQHGLRSETARRMLNHHGYKNVRNLTGGLVAIRKLNLQTSNR